MAFSLRFPGGSGKPPAAGTPAATGTPPANAPEGLAVCQRCTTEHVSACESAILEVTRRIVGKFQAQDVDFDPTDDDHLNLLEKHLGRSGLKIDRNDEALMSKITGFASTAAP